MVVARLSCTFVLLCSGLALAAPPIVRQAECGRGTNSLTGEVTFLGPVVPGERLLLAVWWSGTDANVLSVTDDSGGTWRAVSPKLGVASADPFSVAVYESIVLDAGIPRVTVTMDTIPMGAGFNLIDLTLLQFAGVAELGATSWHVDAGETVLAGPVDTVVPDELIVAYAGANAVITSSNGGLLNEVDCFGDSTATRVAPTPGSWGGTFTGSPGMDWASVTVALRPTVADAGTSTDAGTTEPDAGTQSDAGTTEPDAGPKHYLVGCSSIHATALLCAALLFKRRRVQRLP